jgi:hypothetical protein
MGFSTVTVKFTISKDDLFRTLLSEPVEINTIEGEKLTIHDLTNHHVKTRMAEGIVVHRFDALMSYKNRTHQSHEGMLVSLVGGNTFAGEFVLEVYPNDNLSE